MLQSRDGKRTLHAAVRIALDMLDQGLIAADVVDTTLHEGDLLTLDGNEGALYAGAAQTEIR